MKCKNIFNRSSYDFFNKKIFLSSLTLFLFTFANTSANAQSSLTYEEINGVVAVEAENYNSKGTNGSPRDWYEYNTSNSPNVPPDPDASHIYDDNGNASGLKYMEVLPDTRVDDKVDPVIYGENFFPTPGTGPQLNYKVRFNSPGTYYVWTRAYSVNFDDNGLHVGINGTWPASGIAIQWCPNKFDWTWTNHQRGEDPNGCGDNPRLYITINVPTAGVHTISFSAREDGFEFDKWVMTKTQLFRPGDFERAYTQNGPAENPEGSSPPPSNAAPNITSSANVNAVVDTAYTYDVNATDSNDADNTLVYSLDNSPSGMSINSSSGVINWTPAGSQVGGNSVTVRVVDPGGLSDTQAFTVNVTTSGTPPPPTNEAPTITTQPPLDATVGILYTYDADATDPNDALNTLVFTLEREPTGMTIDSATGVITWTPAAGQEGEQDAVVRVTDPGGLSDGKYFILTVAPAGSPPPANQGPTINSSANTSATEGAAYSYDVSATDPNDAANTLVYSLDTSPSGMSINSGSGVISWTPSSNQVGNNNVTVRVTDPGTLFDTQAFTINVAAASSPPPSNEAPSLTTQPSTLNAIVDILYTYDVDATDPNDADNTLVFSLEQQPTGMTIDSATGLISWIPVDGQEGLRSAVVRVTDPGGLNDGQYFELKVAPAGSPPPANQAPSITSSANLNATEGVAYSYDVNATDPNDADNTLVYSLDNAPSGMNVNANSGVISWTPANSQVGSNSVTVKVVDPGGMSDTQTYSINVTAAPTPTNEAPSITSQPASLNATVNVLYTYDVQATDPNDADNTLIYTLEQEPAGMTVDSGTGLISWTPSAGQEGNKDAVIRVTDPGGLDDGQYFIISVAAAGTPPPQNTAPDITSTPVTTVQDGSLYTYDVNADDAELGSGDILGYSLETAPTGMTINVTTGLISWVPGNQVGTHSVAVKVEDLGQLSDMQAFDVIVSNPTQPLAVNLQLSLSSDRSNDFQLNGSTVAGNIFVFLQNDVSISQVRFLLDGVEQNTDSAQPWDFTGDLLPNSSNAIAFDTNTVSNGLHTISADINNGAQLVEANFTIDNGGANSRPIFTSDPNENGTDGSLYSYDADASDADLNNGDVLTFSLVTPPQGMTIDSSTGVVNWTPSAQSGLHSIKIKVTDNGQLFDEQFFMLAISSSATNNSPPTIPQLVSPADNIEVSDTTITFAWRRSADTDALDTINYQLIFCEGTDITACGDPIDIASIDLSPGQLIAGMSGLSIMMMGMIASGWSRRKSIMIAVVLVVMTQLVSCGSSSSSANPSQQSDNSTHTISNLERGKLYVWQVVAMDSDTSGAKGGISISEVRTLRVAP